MTMTRRNNGLNQYSYLEERPLRFDALGERDTPRRRIWLARGGAGERGRDEINESKKHEDRHEANAKADHDANQKKVLKTRLTLNEAQQERAKEQRKLVDRFKTNRQQDQRDCKRGSVRGSL
jgi:hypothetical protein